MKKNLVAVMLGMISLVLVGCGAPKQINDSVTIEAGDELVLEASDFFESEDGIEFDDSAVDTSKVGEYEVTATYKNKEFNIKVDVVDTTAPEFELVQDSIVTNDVGSLDAESLIASIEDVSDTTAELKFETEPEEDGEYEASVVVTDEYGNSSEKSITVVLDTTAPTISGVENETVKQADVTVEPTIDFSKYSAEDSRDGVVECETSMEKTGDKEYTVTVTATDEAGNVATETAVVKVEASTTNSGKSAGSGKSASSSGSSGASQAASQSSQPEAPAPSVPEAPAETPSVPEAPAEESNSNQLDASNAVTIDRPIAPGETLTPDNFHCSICGFDTTNPEEAHAHLRDVHGMQV